MIRTHADVRARVHLGAALADQDVAGQNSLAAEALHAQTLAVGVAAVTSAAACLLCAMLLLPESNGLAESAGREIGDLHFREGLTMVLATQIVLAPAELHDRYLLALAVADDRGGHLAALEQRGAQLHVGAVAHEQHLAELDRGAWLGIQLLDAQRGVFGNPVLLTTGGDDRVHEGYSGKDRRLDERSRILLSDPHPVKPVFPQAECVLSLGSAGCYGAISRKVGRRIGCGARKAPPLAVIPALNDARRSSRPGSFRHGLGGQRDPRTPEEHGSVGRPGGGAHHRRGGKRLRPLIVVLTSRACSGQGEKYFEAAAFIEFIHTATLLHDDVVDGSSMRRGRDTANEVFGNQASVLVGDFVYSRAFQMMAGLSSSA